MNMKVIINALLIILVIHLLTRNISYKKIFSNGITTETLNTTHNMMGNNKSINFLIDKDVDLSENFETKCVEKKEVNKSYQNLVDYVNKCDDHQVKPGNYYVTDENTSNFTSNVLNVNKFYDKNLIGDYDGLSQLTPSDYVEPPLTKEQEVGVIDQVGNQTCFPNRNINDNTEIIKPDNWKYKDEVPMNGGEFMKDLVGFDNLESAYANYGDIYNKSCDPSLETSYSNCYAKPDDLRMGLGNPNREYRETR